MADDGTVLCSPFLTLEQAAFFLQVPFATARWMYDHHRLPRALRLDGGIYEPVPGRVLIPCKEFEALVKDEAYAMLRLWQNGRVDLPRPESPTSPAPALKSVVPRGERS